MGRVQNSQKAHPKVRNQARLKVRNPVVTPSPRVGRSSLLSTLTAGLVAADSAVGVVSGKQSVRRPKCSWKETTRPKVSRRKTGKRVPRVPRKRKSDAGLAVSRHAKDKSPSAEGPEGVASPPPNTSPYDETIKRNLFHGMAVCRENGANKTTNRAPVNDGSPVDNAVAGLIALARGTEEVGAPATQDQQPSSSASNSVAAQMTAKQRRDADHKKGLKTIRRRATTGARRG